MEKEKNKFWMQDNHCFADSYNCRSAFELA